jgi:TRAP-type C4-dicarboxylate transport system substrate-binding protein
MKLGKILATLSAGFVIATGAGLPAAQAATTLTMSSWVPPTHFLTPEVFQPWIDDVKRVTEGRVEVRILPKPVGAPAQHRELARKGVAEITWGNFTYEPDRFKAVWFAEMPFTGTKGEASSVALWETYQKYLASQPAFAGVVMLGIGLFGGGQIHHGGKAVVEPDDLKNQKVRMGGPIQKRLLEDLGAVPVAGPGPKAYELLESGVVDASLHSLESVINFRVEDKLKHHTIIPGGFYDASFFVAINEGKWAKLSEADRKAIMGVSGEHLSRLWGQRFDAQNKAAEAKMRAEGHVFSVPSKALLERIGAVRERMLADWAAEGASYGVDKPLEMLQFFEQRYKAHAGQ